MPKHPSGVKPNVGKAYDYMELSFRTAIGINALPFTYDTRRRRFAVNPRGLKFAIWFVLMFSGVLIEVTQMVKELLKTLTHKDVGRSDWCLLCLLCISWWLLLTCHYTVLRKHSEMVNHLNQTLWTREWLTEERLPKTKDHKLVHVHLWFGNLQAIGQCFLVAAEGTKSYYIYSNVPEEYRNSVTVAIWTAYAFYRVMSNSLAGYFQYFVTVLHVNTLSQILHLRQKERMSTEEKLKTYRIIQILSGQYNEAYSMFTVHLTIFAVENLIVGIYGTIKFYDKMPFDKYINFPLMCIIMLIFIFTFYIKNSTLYSMTDDEYRNTYAALVAESEMGLHDTDGHPAEQRSNQNSGREGGRRVSNEIVTERNRIALKEAICTARSCARIGIPFGNLYYIKQSTALNVLDFTCCNTISTLITYP